MTESNFKNQAEFERWVVNASRALTDRNRLNRRVGELENENRELKEKLYVLGEDSFQPFTLREPPAIVTNIELTPMTLFRMQLRDPYHFHVLLQHRIPDGGFQSAHMISLDAYKQCGNKDAFIEEMISMFVHEMFKPSEQQDFCGDVGE